MDDVGDEAGRPRPPQRFHGVPYHDNDAPPEHQLVRGDRMVSGIDEWIWDGGAWVPR